MSDDRKAPGQEGWGERASREFSRIAFDVESYPDWFLACFVGEREDGTREVKHYEASGRSSSLDVKQRDDLIALMENAPCLVSFNGTRYDVAMLRSMATGKTTEDVNALSQSLVTGKGKPEYLKHNPERHIDCERLVVGMRGLKELSAMLHLPSIEELPHDPHSDVGNGDVADRLKAYCVNDCMNTLALHDRLSEQVALRGVLNEKYPLPRGTGFSFALESQIGERLIESRCGDSPPTPTAIETFRWKPPAYLKFKDDKATELLSDYADAMIEAHPGGGVKLPPELRLKAKAFKYDGENFVFGVGGLHSAQPEPVFAKAVPGEYEIRDYDVASYYPSILLRNSASPVDGFCDAYKHLVDQRLKAKANGDIYEASGLKIAINGTFGKLDQPGSAVYSPPTFFDTIATGQFGLLMLVEKLSDAGATVLSANTDGVIVSCDPREHDLDNTAIKEWEKDTGFVLERTDYSVLAMRDVNNYVAVQPDGKIKGKGVYAPVPAEGALRSRPMFNVCASATLDWLQNGVQPEDHINACNDLRMFLCVRKMNAGVVDGSGNNIGKVVRFYKSTRPNTVLLCHAERGRPTKLVPDGRNAKAVSVLVGSPPEVPDDLDRDFYIKRAHDMVLALGDQSLEKTRTNAQVDMFDI